MGEHNSFASQWPSMYDRKVREQKANRIIKILEDYYGNGKLKDLTLLDIGSSTGIIDNKLATKFKRVLGTDTDGEAIAYAKKSFKKKNLTFSVKDAMKLELPDNSFDVVVCAQVYEHVPNAKKLFLEIYRVLKPCGICYLAALNKLWPIEPHYTLPFLSWLPKPIANIYLRIARRKNYYEENLKTYWELKKLTGKFKRLEYTQKILRDPTKFGYESVFNYPTPFVWIIGLLSPLLKHLVPTFFWILQKKF